MDIKMTKSILKNVTLVCFLLISTAANAGMITIFSDINSMNSATSGRDQLLLNTLGGANSVLVSKQNNASYNTDFSGFYNGLSGVTGTFSGAELTNQLLSGIDLLFINNGCCGNSGQPYSSDETTVISNFLSSGGSLALLSEPCCGGDVAGMNLFLSQVGSTMSFGGHKSGGATVINDTVITAGVSGYNPNTFNHIMGGISAVEQGGFTAVAYEYTSDVPESGPIALLLLSLGMLFTSRKVK